jgi:hypothetical protein
MAIESFIDFLVNKTVEAIQITDPSISGSADDDPLVRALANAEYFRVSAYCNRKFMRDTFVEEYHSVIDHIIVRNSPVVQLLNVWVNDVEQVEGTDYTLVGNRIKLLKPPAPSSLDPYASYPYDGFFPSSSTIIRSRKDRDVIVKYVGGYESAEESPELFNALLLQTTAMYNRRSTIGVGTVSGRTTQTGVSSVDGANDGGDLIDIVKQMISPLISYADVDYV